jgi:hypothetical protein
MAAVAEPLSQPNDRCGSLRHSARFALPGAKERSVCPMSDAIGSYPLALATTSQYGGSPNLRRRYCVSARSFAEATRSLE